MPRRLIASMTLAACLLSPLADAAASAQAVVDPTPPAPLPAYDHSAASPLMMSLYVTTAVIQGLDAHSTFKALDAGAVESNPFFGDISRHRSAFVAFKAGVAAAVIYAASGTAHKSRVRAVLALTLINSVYFAIAKHNYQVARIMRDGGK